MEKITAAQFDGMIAENPSVFEHWDTPLEITEYIDCSDFKLTHLSKHLTFSGKNSNEETADFWNCENLKIATGKFEGYVRFAESGIEKIENLIITQTDINGWAASFEHCLNLKIATGHYPGFVQFFDCGIHSIQNLRIEKPKSNGVYADFSLCPNLQTLEGWDIFQKILVEPEKLEAEIKRRIALKKFHKETDPSPLPFL
jgi:hypothetical protein